MSATVGVRESCVSAGVYEIPRDDGGSRASARRVKCLRVLGLCLRGWRSVLLRPKDEHRNGTAKRGSSSLSLCGRPRQMCLQRSFLDIRHKYRWRLVLTLCIQDPETLCPWARPGYFRKGTCPFASYMPRRREGHRLLDRAAHLQPAWRLLTSAARRWERPLHTATC